MVKTVACDYDFRMSYILHEGRRGSFKLKKETIPSGTILNMYSSEEGRFFKGQHTFDYRKVILLKDDQMLMSDSQRGVESLKGAIKAARGDVLMGGLGIGLLPTFIKDKESVNRIDIVELYQEVIDLVFGQIASPKMRAINDDIFHYLDTTSNKYDFIHIDIWGSLDAPLGEIDRIRDKAKRCLKPDGSVWCWLQELLDREDTEQLGEKS